MITRQSATRLLLATMLLLPTAAIGQTSDAIERSLGLPAASDSGVEVRVWIGGHTRVSTLYRLVKTSSGVAAERYALADVVRATAGGSTAEARRETNANRRLVQKERCLGKIVEGLDHIWCRVVIRADGPWDVLFEDLLPAELWKLPPQGRPDCGPSLVVVDGEAVRIDMLEPGRRHGVEYLNPDICCRTLACAVVDHVRNVVRNIS